MKSLQRLLPGMQRQTKSIRRGKKIFKKRQISPCVPAAKNSRARSFRTFLFPSASLLAPPCRKNVSNAAVPQVVLPANSRAQIAPSCDGGASSARHTEPAQQNAHPPKSHPTALGRVAESHRCPKLYCTFVSDFYH